MRCTLKQYLSAAGIALIANALLLYSIVWLNEITQPQESNSNAQRTYFQLDQNPTPKKSPPLESPSLQVASMLSTPLPKLNLPSAIQMPNNLLDDWTTLTNLSDLTDGVSSGELIFKEDAVDNRAKLLSRARPRYPRLAKRQGLGGEVTFRIIVGQDGSVQDVELLDAQPPGIFEASAEAAIRQYKYSPARVDGKPVRSFYRQKIIFRVRD